MKVYNHLRIDFFFTAYKKATKKSNATVKLIPIKRYKALIAVDFIRQNYFLKSGCFMSRIIVGPDFCQFCLNEKKLYLAIRR